MSVETPKPSWRRESSDQKRTWRFRGGAHVRLAVFEANCEANSERHETDVTESRSESDLVEAIAHRVVELLRTHELWEHQARLVDAATLARELGVERDWVYANSERLGAIRLGGPRGRLRFDREVVAEKLGDSSALGQAARRRISQRRRRSIRQRELRSQGNGDRSAEVKSSQIQRRASGRTPARSPKQHQTGGSPHDEA